MKQLLKISIYGVFLLTAGCDTVKTELGLDRHTPDEFAVMQRAPLEIPTDMTSLPVPQPGMDRPQDVTAKQQAEDVILGDVASRTAGANSTTAIDKPSAAENALINKAGGGTTDSQIRQKLAAESDQGDKDKRTVVKRIMSIGDNAGATKVVDAEAEAKRIQDAKKAGKPITEGITPSIDD